MERDWARIRRLAKVLKSDGCTRVSQYAQDCCFLHDVMYKLHLDPDTGKDVTRAEADRIFRDCVRTHSRFGKCSPLAQIRYWGVRLFGRFFRGDRIPADGIYPEPPEPPCP